jgi:hypothetical protein
MKPVYFLCGLLLIVGCQNRDLNEDEVFKPRELNPENFREHHFTRITVDGVEYIMLAFDNNNPHEGFGFMAFRANRLLEKTDTLIAYAKTNHYIQTRIYAQVMRMSLANAQMEMDSIFRLHLGEEEKELTELEKVDLISK